MSEFKHKPAKKSNPIMAMKTKSVEKNKLRAEFEIKNNAKLREAASTAVTVTAATTAQRQHRLQ